MCFEGIKNKFYLFFPFSINRIFLCGVDIVYFQIIIM
jgi:hypothetical protein